MGGNKLRKLNAVIPLLQAHGITDVVACGSCQSAHTAAVGLGALTSKLHRYLVDRFGQELEFNSENVPENRVPGDNFAEGSDRAWLEYGDPNAAVLMIVHAKETNMYDQHWLSFKLYESYGAKVIRRAFAEVDAEAKLDDKRTLVIGEQPRFY